MCYLRSAVVLVVLASLACAQKEGRVDDWKKLVDPAKAAEVPVVLRVRFVQVEGGNKYSWDRVKVLGIIKNESGFTFPEELLLAHYTAEPGIPQGDCTVYLERYNDAGDPLWKLRHASGREGVSHSSGG